MPGSDEVKFVIFLEGKYNVYLTNKFIDYYSFIGRREETTAFIANH
jgi:hypothetical protein